MQLSEQEAESLMQEGLEALRQGRSAEARTRFEKLTASAPVGELPWLLLADARRAEGDTAGEEAALNRLLDIERQSVRGHIMKGDCRARAGDDEMACYFYRAALRLAKGGALPPEVTAEVGQAERELAKLEARTRAKREARLTARGLPPHTWSPRFRHSLEPAAGRLELDLQQPTSYTYPELPQIQFYDPTSFDWAPAIEEAAQSIREELIALLEKGADEFRPYIQSDVGSVPLEANKALLNSMDWSVLSLCERGWLAPGIVRRCPRTWETILNHAPLPRIAGWGPTVLFSMLKAGAHIAPHTGMYNTRLICHLPLIVPPGCRFRVGNEVREWEEGKLLIFDDTVEHEAWNDGAEDRVVLIFDIWRPELTDQEKHELTALFSD
jgi:aspartyl/asparaginyl beta-hydroxylase (cupin superfamily)